MPENDHIEKTALPEEPRLGLSDPFEFSCEKSFSCFTHCCQDVAIVLTPYDALRLKRALRLDSSEFLERHTLSAFTPQEKIPIVMLKMEPENKTCPFVTAEGCRVYASRPWACRMYPLGVADPERPTPSDRKFYFLVREDICHGHACGRKLTVGEWLAEQGVEQDEMMGASFKDLMLHPFWRNSQGLSPHEAAMCFMALYDLDRFRRFVLESSFLQRFDVDEARVEALRTDDVELLDFGVQWIRFSLFHEKALKMKRPVAEDKVQAVRCTE
jgi:Fe-S-cluster containining protein